MSKHTPEYIVRADGAPYKTFNSVDAAIHYACNHIYASTTDRERIKAELTAGKTARYGYGFKTVEIEPLVSDAIEALKLTQKLMTNLMAKGNVDWGNTFGIDFGLMNETLIKVDRAVAKAEGRS